MRTVRGINFVLRETWGLAITDAPLFYSIRARVIGLLCPSCDLGLPFSCECPPACLIDAPRMITIDTRGAL